MIGLRGIEILDLIPDLPPGAQGILPDEIAGFLNRISIVEHTTITTQDWFTHGGVLQGATDQGLQLPANLPLTLPGLNAGVPFQLSWPRTPASTSDPEELEPGPDRWILDIYVGRISVPFPDRHPPSGSRASPGSRNTS